MQTEWCVFVCRVSLTIFLTSAVDLRTMGRVSGLTDVYTMLFLKCTECQVFFYCTAALKVKLINGLLLARD